MILITIIATTETNYAQKIATLEVNVGYPPNGLQIPLRIDLDAITFLSESNLSLVEVIETGKRPVDFQIEDEGARFLYWMVGGEKTGKRTFQLIEVKRADHPANVLAVEKDGALTIQSGGMNLLRYHNAMVYPPTGVDSAFKRSGFIHPLWSPKGQVLTRIQPADHRSSLWNMESMDTRSL